MAGTLRQRGKKGTWQFDLVLPDGSRLQKSLGTADKAEALRRAADLERQLTGGLKPEPGLTVAQWLERWLDGLTGPSGSSGRTPTTLRAYQVRAAYITSRIGKKKLESLTRADVEAMDRDLLQRGGKGGTPLAPATVTGIHTILTEALNEAVANDLLMRNVAALARKPKIEKQEAPWLEDAEIAKLLNAAPDHPWRDVAALGVMTGLRRGELAGLRWSDVNWDEKELRVERQRRYDGPGAGLTDADPKSKKGKRAVPLSDDAVALLQQIASRLADRVAAVGQGVPPWVFCHWRNARWQPFAPSALSRGVRLLYKAAGLDAPLHPLHTLRHSFDTLLGDAGVHPAAQAAMLGHTEKQTLDYTHRLRRQERQAVDEVGRRLRGEASQAPVTGQ